MNRFLPWIGGVIGVAIIATGGYFGYSSYSNGSSQRQNNQEEVNSPDPVPERDLALCNGSENVVFEDEILVFAIRSTLGIPAQDEASRYTVPCDALLKLEELKAPTQAIGSVKGLEYAINLKKLDLRENYLLSHESLFGLPNLDSINLTQTGINNFLSASKNSLRYLDLGKNALTEIDSLNIGEYKKLSSLNLHTNKISDFRPLLEILSLSQTFSYISIFNNPIDLSVNKESRQIIDQLIAQGIEVVWDELNLDLRVGDGARAKEVSVDAPDIVSLTALVSVNETFSQDIEIESVEFFEITSTGALSSIHVDSEAPFSFGVGFDENEIGTFRYVAEVRTKRGATFLTSLADAVTVRVTKPECLKNADCNDNNQCTNNSCINKKCAYTPIAGCGESECKNDSDCSDSRECTSDRCVSGKCEHYMQTSCVEGKKETICYDGTDNDKDGKIDCRDSDCSVEATCGEICDNGINDDGDSNVDCNDRRDCADHPSCQVSAQSCNSDVSLYCYAFADTVRCSLNMAIKGSNNACSASVVTCDRTSCWSSSSANKQEFNFQGCESLKTKLQTSPDGTVLKGNAALGLGEAQTCGGLNLCRRIILCD